ncbi:MAG: hypothetical protein JWQ10_125 [Herbaspirillum sp.]|nr:hypothetical protein [Herbaspirillum sp.]
MIRQYLKFFINGGILGVAATALQLLIYKMMSSDSAIAYSFASALTYMPLIIVNFLIQRSWIFGRRGLFWRFVVSNLIIMALVSFLSPICRHVIDAGFGTPYGERTGFLVAALLGSIPSFLLTRFWVFGFGKRNAMN